MNDGPPEIFDRRAYRARRARAVRAGGGAFLAEDAAARLAERLSAVNRKFVFALDLGSREAGFAALRPHASSWVRASLVPGRAPMSLAAGEEALPFATASFDLAVSVLSLHAVNDLPGALVQIRRALKPDGFFLAALFGGETLTELRQAMAAAESDTAGGLSPRISPFADVRELGTLLQRAGFAMPVADVERTIVRYGTLEKLFSDLRGLGETNVLAARRKAPLPRRVLAALAREYGSRFGDPGGRLKATFEIVNLAGWAPHESQPKALKPGSAKASLAEALGSKEIPTGEKPG